MRKDYMPWLLLPGVALTLSGVSLLAPRQAAQAAAPVQAAPKAPTAAPAAGADDDGDGDGDELLEHWGDPQFSREAQRQMAGMAAGFFVLGAAAVRRRALARRHAAVRQPSRAGFLALDSQATAAAADARPTDTRKAA